MSFGPWGEGDTLSPTNLNARGGGPFSTTSMVNVSWSMFSASRNTASIQSAINYASTNNIATIVIPQSYLPYDTSTISDIYSVHRVREGGNLSLTEFDITAYGADPAGSNDASIGMQAVLDAAAGSSSVVGIRKIKVPPGRFGLHNPIWVKGSGTVIEGSSQGYNSTSAAPSRLDFTVGAGGPLVYVQGSSATVQNLVTALATGSGQAYQLPTGFSSLAFRLREDMHTLDLNGLSAFCVEFFCKLPTATGATGNIVSSGGRWILTDTNNRAFSVGKNSSEQIFTRMQLSTTGTVTLTGTTAISDGVVRHIALTYDGSTVRLFVNGALETSAIGSGTLVQDPAEEVIVGASWTVQPKINGDEAAAPVIIDSLRVSNTARYTTAFTAPTAKFSADVNTLALLNFDDTKGALVKVTSSVGSGWAAQRGTAVGNCSGLQVRGITISNSETGRGTAFFLGGANVTEWGLADVQILFCRNAVLNNDNGNFYDWSVRRLFVFGGGSGGRYGLCLSINGGLGHVETSWFQGLAAHCVIQGEVKLTNVFHQMDTKTVFGAVYHNGLAAGIGANLDNCNFNTEPGVSSSYRGALAFGGTSQAAGVIAKGCGFETGNNQPHLLCSSNNVTVAEFTACTFINSGTATSIATVASAPVRPIRFNNCIQGAGWRQWSNLTGTAVVGQIGPFFSSSTGSTIRFDASLADEWDLTLTSDVTQSSWQSISYGQPVSGAIKMDSTGSRLFVWPTNSKGTVTLSYGSAAVNTFTGFYDGVNVILTSVRTGL